MNRDGVQLSPPIQGFAGEVRTVAENLLPGNVSPDALNIDYRDGTVRKRKGVTHLGEDTTLLFAPIEAMMWRIQRQFFLATRNGVYTTGATYGQIEGLKFALAVDADRDFRAQLIPWFPRYLTDAVVCNGVEENYLVAVEELLSLPAPEMSGGLTITAAGSGGSLSAGVYSYQFSIYNSITGAESATGLALSTQTAVSSDEFTIDFTSGGWDPGSWAGADKIRIYRTTANGSVYYHVADVALAATSYVDDMSDATLITRALLGRHGYAAPSRFGFVLNSSLWLGNQEDAESTLVFTDPGTLADFHVDNSLVVGQGDGDELTGGLGVGDRACVFKRRSTWLLSGAGSEARIDLLFPGVGCVQHATIVASHEALYWLGEGGVYRMPLPFGAGAPEDLTADGWRDFFSPMTDDDYENCCGLWDPIDERYFLTVTVAGTRWVLVFCARRNAWALWDLDASAFGLGGADGVSRLYCGFRGFMAEMESSLSDAQYSPDFFAQAMFGEVTGGSASTLVNSEALWLQSPPAGVLANMDVTVIHEGGTMETRRVVSNTDTVLTVSPDWDTAPVAGEEYYLGAIEAYWRTPALGMDSWSREKQVHKVRLLSRVPSDVDEAASVVKARFQPDGDVTRREEFDWPVATRVGTFALSKGRCREAWVQVSDFSPDQTFDLAGIALAVTESEAGP